MKEKKRDKQGEKNRDRQGERKRDRERQRETGRGLVVGNFFREKPAKKNRERKMCVHSAFVKKH